MNTIKAARITVMLGVTALAGCGVPQFDVYYNPAGEPSAYLINQRIRCELADLVRKDDGTLYTHKVGNDYYKYKYGYALVRGDYDIQMTIYLEVNDTGGLTPTLKWIDPINTKLNTSFSLGATGQLQESRDHTYTESIAFPLSQIINEIDIKNDPTQSKDRCPRDGTDSTNLSGVLGIKDFVDLAMSLPQSDQDLAQSAPGAAAGQSGPSAGGAAQPTASPKQDFGGTIQFLVTKSISAGGPTWALTHFNGPGGLLGLSQVSTNKLTIGFGLPTAPHPPSKPGAPSLAPRPNPRLDQFMLNLNANYTNSQLLQIENSLH